MMLMILYESMQGVSRHLISVSLDSMGRGKLRDGEHNSLLA